MEKINLNKITLNKSLIGFQRAWLEIEEGLLPGWEAEIKQAPKEFFEMHDPLTVYDIEATGNNGKVYTGRCRLDNMQYDRTTVNPTLVGKGQVEIKSSE